MEPGPELADADARIATTLSWIQTLGIGAAQPAALVPGISRSGSSMVGGLLSRLNNENAARFSFLLVTPIIGAAAVLKLPELLSPAMAFFETRTLTPFAIHCVAGGAAYFVAMLIIG